MRPAYSCALLLPLIFIAALPAAAAQPRPSPAVERSGQGAQARAHVDQPAALGVLQAINSGEIAAGQLAVAQARDGRTRAYAQQMIDEHAQNNRMLGKWNADSRAAPAQAKAAEAARTLSMLERAKGAAFDGAYLQAMVTDHQAALQTLDNTLIPAAHDAEVKAFLQTTRDHVRTHHQLAQQLLEQMTAKPTGTTP